MKIAASSNTAVDITFFEDLFRSIWARLVPTLGIVNVRALLRHALEESRERHSPLDAIRIQDDGLRFDELKTLVKNGAVSQKETLGALREYLAALIHLLAQLTGEIVSRQIIEIVHIKQKKDKVKGDIL